MKKTILFLLLLGLTWFSGIANTYCPNHFAGESQRLEFTIVRVKYSIKKIGIVSQVYADIGTSPKHSLVNSLETVSDGVFKIGYGKETVVFSNEVDVLNYFSANGWEVVRISEVKVMSSNYTQYLFSKETIE
jgi:hypothetical protein